MSEIIYNLNNKQKGLPYFYSRKRSKFSTNPFPTLKRIQKTNRLTSTQYTSILSDINGSQTNKNSKNTSYERYLRQLKATELKSNGLKMGVVSGWQCGENLEAEFQEQEPIHIVYTESIGVRNEAV